MTNKAILLMCLASVCSGVLVDYHGKETKDGAVSSSGHPLKWELVNVLPPSKEHLWYKYGVYTYPKYEFEYAVSDHHTGDHKRHKETRDGDHVQGEYSLIEPDGSLRKVQYSADDHTGFNAIVSKTMHKHGDNAYSFTGHTRHFLPVGHGQKSKPYTHSAYHKTHEEPGQLSDHIAFKPVAVKAPKDMKVVKIEDMKALPVVVISTNSGDNAEATSKEISANAMTNPVAMPVDTINVETPVAAPATSDQNDSLPVTMQEVMAYIMAARSNQGQLVEMKSQTNEVNERNVPNGEIPQPQNLPVMETLPAEEKKEGDQPEPVADSSASSSYYRSHVYYLGY